MRERPADVVVLGRRAPVAPEEVGQLERHREGGRVGRGSADQNGRVLDGDAQETVARLPAVVERVDQEAARCKVGVLDDCVLAAHLSATVPRPIKPRTL